MRIYLKSLPTKVQKDVKSALRGNGLDARKVKLYSDGRIIVVEMHDGRTVTIATI